MGTPCRLSMDEVSELIIHTKTVPNPALIQSNLCLGNQYLFSVIDQFCVTVMAS